MTSACLDIFDPFDPWVVNDAKNCGLVVERDLHCPRQGPNQSSLEAKCSRFADAPKKRMTFGPHCTISRAASQRRSVSESIQGEIND